MKRFFICLVAIVFGVPFLAYVVFNVWFRYEWDVRVPSPDGRYDLVVLRGDLYAIADFDYLIYLFPHDLTPKDQPKWSPVRLTSIWWNYKYFVYSGFDYPMIRWTDENSIEINLSQAFYMPFTVEHVKRFESDASIAKRVHCPPWELDSHGHIIPQAPCPLFKDSAILITVVFEKEDKDLSKPDSRYVEP